MFIRMETEVIHEIIINITDRRVTSGAIAIKTITQATLSPMIIVIMVVALQSQLRGSPKTIQHHI
jgi:hypothetical protein